MLNYPVNFNFQQHNPGVQWPQVMLFEDDNFGGSGIGPIYMSTDVLIQGIGGPVAWKETSSIIITAGTWEFFKAPGFAGPVLRLPAGRYPSVSAAANDPSWNDAILSLRYISVT